MRDIEIMGSRMTQFPTRLKLAALATFALTSAALAAEPKAEARTAVFQNLIDCKGKTAAAERLACYDAAVSSLDVAEKKGDIVLVDREQARAARKQAFGFALPSMAMFDRGEKPEELDRVATTVVRAYQGGDRRWTVELAGGAVWAQNDDEALARAPKAGSKAEVRKAAMGYFMNLDGQRAVRARRVK